MLQRCKNQNEMNRAWPEIWVRWHFYIMPGIIYRATIPGLERRQLWRWTRQGFKGISQPKIHSQHFCGAQLSAQPAQLLGSALSLGSTSARLCCPCQRLDTPTAHSPKLFHCTRVCPTVHQLEKEESFILWSGSCGTDRHYWSPYCSQSLHVCVCCEAY